MIVRSDVGKRLLEKLEVVKGNVNKEEIAKLAILKKNRAKKHFAPLLEDVQVQAPPQLQQG